MEVRWLGTSNQGQKEGSNITVAWELRVISTMYMNSGYLTRKFAFYGSFTIKLRIFTLKNEVSLIVRQF